jgi:protein-S-isoprenylcysteine O-methyltransferase Ste14
MNLLHPWNAFFAACFVVFLGIRRRWIDRTKGETKALRRIDLVERILLTAMRPGTLVLPLLYLLTSWLSFADYSLPGPVKALGAMLIVASLVLFAKSHAALGRNWSVSLEIREGHELVTGGLYARWRHPMYSAILGWSVAQGLLLENWLAGWSMLPAMLALVAVRVPREERMMTERFGDAYVAYMARTHRLAPKLRA